jgi:hypothetical protein
VPCWIRICESGSATLLLFDQGTDDEKLFLERRYGKRELQLLNTNLLSEDYLSANAKVGQREAVPGAALREAGAPAALHQPAE